MNAGLRALIPASVHRTIVQRSVALAAAAIGVSLAMTSAATPEPTPAPFVMGGGPPASMSGDPIGAAVAVVVLGVVAVLVTVFALAVTSRGSRPV